MFDTTKQGLPVSSSPTDAPQPGSSLVLARIVIRFGALAILIAPMTSFAIEASTALCDAANLRITPRLHSIGIEWNLLTANDEDKADTDHDAECSVSYSGSPSGEAPLLRVDFHPDAEYCCVPGKLGAAKSWNGCGGSCCGGTDCVDPVCDNPCHPDPPGTCIPVDYQNPLCAEEDYKCCVLDVYNQCNGSILGLQPGESYDLTIRLEDEGNVVTCPVTVETLPEPSLPAPAVSLHVDDDSACVECLDPNTPVCNDPSSPDCCGNLTSGTCCDGSAAKPFANLENVDRYINRCLAKGVNCPEAGELEPIEVLIHDGEYEGEDKPICCNYSPTNPESKPCPCHDMRQSGAPDAYIAYKAAPGEVPMIGSTFQIRPRDGGCVDGINPPPADRCGNLWFEGLTFEPISPVPFVPGTDSCKLNENLPMGQDGIFLYYCSYNTDNLVIKDNVFVNTIDAVVTFQSQPDRFLNTEWFDERAGKGWYIADNWVQPSCEDDGKPYVYFNFQLQLLGELDIARNRLTLARNHCKNDMIHVNSVRDIDIYHNDLWRGMDDSFEPDYAFANVRIWENRIVGAGATCLSAQPQLGAPWYYVRNECVGYFFSPPEEAETGGADIFKRNVFDRTVVLNNTLVAQSRYGQGGADQFFRMMMRNNFWIHRYNHDSTSGAMWFGWGDDYGGYWPGTTPFLLGMPGFDRADWRTDIDFDGFDPDDTPLDPNSPNIDSCGLKAAPLTEFVWFGPNSCDAAPRDGSLANVSEFLSSCASHPLTMHNTTGEMLPRSSCASTVNGEPCTHCIEAEGNAVRLDRNQALDLFAPGDPIGSLEQYTHTPFPKQRLTLRSCADGTYPGAKGDECAVDRGSPSYDLLTYKGPAPDMGAHERGARPFELGPRGDGPVSLTVDRNVSDEPVLTWKTRVRNSSGYVIQRRELTATTWADLPGPTPGPGDTTYTDTSATGGTEYAYRIRPSAQSCDWWYSPEAGTACVDVDCDDGDPCTEDDCDTTEGCQHYTVCAGNATCTGTPGPGLCVCDAGFQGDWLSCADVDECLLGTDDCGANATCTNTAGSFSCACSTGYEGDGYTCNDIDECALGTNSCDPLSTSCTNTDGGYTCTCPEGYHGSGLWCRDTNECVRETDNCPAATTCINAPASFLCGAPPEHYIGYKIKASKTHVGGAPISPPNKFPKNWVVTVNDTILQWLGDTGTDNPENFVVKKEKTLLLPAQKNVGTAPDLNGLHYLRYQAKPGKESVQPEVNGSFPKPAKHVSRIWELSNQLGSIKVQSKKVTAILVPANKSLSPSPSPPADATHFVCYQVKPVKGEYTDQTSGTCDSEAAVNPKGPCLDDSDCGGTAGQFSSCEKPRFRKDLQAFFIDQFNDCATDKLGGTSFAGTSVEGRCLFDLKKVKELCNPMDKSAVVAPRETSATISGSTATTTQSLLCYQPGLASKFKDTTTAGLASVTIGDKVDPGQSKHVKRRVKDNNPVYAAPGNLFPAPTVVDTNKQELVCIPTEVLGVIPAP